MQSSRKTKAENETVLQEYMPQLETCPTRLSISLRLACKTKPEHETIIEDSE